MTCRNIALTRWLLAACLAAAPAIAPAAQSLSQDETFLAARKAHRAGNPARIARHAANLDGYLLKPWVDYWLIDARIKQAPREEIRAFLARHADSYLAETLRRDWLRLLGKTGQWELFLLEQAQIAGDDAQIGCYGLLARWHLRGGELDLARLSDYWYAPRILPEGCVALAEEALRSGRFDSRHVWDRFRLLTRARAIRAARRTLAFLPRREAPDARQLDAAVSAPSRFLKQLPNVRERAARELAILALSRLARIDPKLAASRWEEVRARFPAADQGYVWGQIATEAARKHIAQTVDWFGAAGEAPLDDEQLAWRTRIALREANWVEVRDAIERMSAQARSNPAWVYWQGRALRELGQTERSSAAFSRIAGVHRFYGQLAAEELGRPMQVPPRAAAATESELSRVAQNPGLRRALALYRLDLRIEATREWNWAIRDMDDRSLLAAAELAGRNEVWDRSINTAERTVLLHDYALRYPAPYSGVLFEQARARALEEPWVLGLVRQESRFIASARSSAGAAGLMQLMPATARWIAKKAGVQRYSWSRVTDVDVNAILGTAYLQHVLANSDGSLALAAAGYNAGPGRALRWRAARPIEGAIYAESIPFDETRDYLKQVMTNTVLYAAVRGGSTRTLKELLGVIAPRP